MKRILDSSVLVAALVFGGATLGTGPAQAALKVNGSSTVNPVVTRAAEILRAEQDLSIVVDTQGGSSGGIASVGDGRVEVGMSSRQLNDGDREKYPGTDFRATTIGIDAVALAVSKDVWDSGLRSLTRDQVRGLYEGRIKNWREVGGPDRRVAFFNKEPGRGTWEVFVDWLYGDADEAPLVSLPEVSSNEEGRTKVGSTRGAVTQLSAAWADGKTVFALALENGHGKTVSPSKGNLSDGLYPLARPLLVLTDGEPTAEARVLIDFLLSERGQKLVEASGYLAAGMSYE